MLVGGWEQTFICNFLNEHELRHEKNKRWDEMYADMQPTIGIRESCVKIERVKKHLAVGANEDIGASAKFRENPCKAHGMPQSKPRPKN